MSAEKVMDEVAPMEADSGVLGSPPDPIADAAAAGHMPSEVAVDAAPEESAGTSARKKRPVGRPPSGKVWDEGSNGFQSEGWCYLLPQDQD